MLSLPAVCRKICKGVPCPLPNSLSPNPRPRGVAGITHTHPDFELVRDALLLLNDYAVNIRYPGEVATKDEARVAVKAMRTVRAFVRQKLEISDEVTR